MASEARYKLLVNEYDEKHCVRIRFVKVAVSFMPTALSAFCFCIVYSIINNFKSSTATQCRAYNILPSVSSAIGGYSPQKEVWKITIVAQAPMRFLMVYLYAVYNLEVLHHRANKLIFLAAVLNIIENISLISLSLFDSSNHYPIHEKSFITFIISSELYMLLLVFMHQYYRRQARNLGEARALRWKKRLVVINIVGILLAMYYFIQHNWSCPNFAYTKFALCEYIVVLSNILYHFTAAYDFNDRDLILSKYGIFLQPR